MLRPEGRVAVLWKGLMAIVDITYTAYLVPLSFAYFHDVRVFNWMSVLDIIGSEFSASPGCCSSLVLVWCTQGRAAFCAEKFTSALTTLNVCRYTVFAGRFVQFPHWYRPDQVAALAPAA